MKALIFGGLCLAALAACLPIFITGREVARWEGGLFLLYYAAYTAYLIMAAQEHAALQAFNGVMLGFVLPLTVVAVVVIGGIYRGWTTATEAAALGLATATLVAAVTRSRRRWIPARLPASSPGPFCQAVSTPA